MGGEGSCVKTGVGGNLDQFLVQGVSGNICTFETLPRNWKGKEDFKEAPFSISFRQIDEYMTHNRGELDLYVDTVLRHFQSGAECLIYDGIDLVEQLPKEKTERNVFRDLLLGEGLLKIEKENVRDRLNPYCRITVKGYSVIYNDGWIKYMERENAVKQLNKDLLSASLKANESLVKTNGSIRTSNIIMPIILALTLVATCVQIGIAWHASNAETYKQKSEHLELLLTEKDTQLKKIESELRSARVKRDTISRTK